MGNETGPLVITGDRGLWNPVEDIVQEFSVTSGPTLRSSVPSSSHRDCDGYSWNRSVRK